LQLVLATSLSWEQWHEFHPSLSEVRVKNNDGSHRNAAAEATALVAHAFGARGYLEAQMMDIGEARVSTHLVLPGDHASAQNHGIYAQALADRFEAEGVEAAAIAHNPSLGIHIEHPLAGAARESSLLVHVDGVGQQREHQALFAGEPMPPRKIVVLTWENLVQPDDAVEDCVGSELCRASHASIS